MFPTISYFIDYLFGIFIPLPFNTFGFFMAVAFAAAFWAFTQELKRKEAAGILHPIKRKERIGEAPQIKDILYDAIFGLLVGYKIGGAILNYEKFVENTEHYLLSTQGSGFMALIGAIGFSYVAYRDKKQQQLAQPLDRDVLLYPHQMMWTILIWAAVAGLLGAKFFHNLEYWDDFMKDPITGLLSFSGLTFYGGLICGAMSVLYYTRKQGIPTKVMLDVGAPGMMLAYGLGRFGCHFSGDGDWGIVSKLENKPSFFPDWFWSFKYPHNVVGEGIPMKDCLGRFCNELPQGVYPTALYEALICLSLFALLWFLRTKITEHGRLFGVYLVFNGVERFLIEKIRVNSFYHFLGMQFTQAELISFVMIIVGAVMFWKLKVTNTPLSSK